ncbi:glycosyltransferase family 4 protein [Salinibacter ruber]|uniref:glycosyltransferase family 4 protein n=1 Tax=Salinibacter ruber TaxID=146919 RepID=UPI0016107E4D|nr:glycosyltransferase family 4 protein [Salinibacter ruber]MBB4062397.1 glycosyltransferase involved in cell wall biosynthesis [Salinibacter ruber]
MRILTISNTPHDPSQGSGYVITGYVEGLRERGHSVDAYGPEDWLWWDVRRARRYLYPLMIASFGLQAYRRKPYDLIELWGGVTWLLAILLRWTKGENATIVHHSNGIEQHRVVVQRQSSAADAQLERWFQWDLSWFYDRGLEAADAIVTVSKYDLPFLKNKRYIPQKRIYTIPNPLPNFFLGQNVQWDRPRRVGFCGNWNSIKNIRLLRNDLPLFLRDHPEWSFSVMGVGDTEVKSDFPEDVRPQIEVIPFLKREKLVDWYHSLAIFTLPSIYESFGLVMAEAMACGVALVATRVGFASGLTDGEEAYVLSKKTSPHLKEALETLAEDEKRRRQMARGGYERVQELRWETATRKLDNIYRNIT